MEIIQYMGITLFCKVEKGRQSSPVGQARVRFSQFVEETVSARLQWRNARRGRVLQKAARQFDGFGRSPSTEYLCIYKLMIFMMMHNGMAWMGFGIAGPRMNFGALRNWTATELPKGPLKLPASTFGNQFWENSGLANENINFLKNAFLLWTAELVCMRTLMISYLRKNQKHTRKKCLPSSRAAPFAGPNS